MKELYKLIFSKSIKIFNNVPFSKTILKKLFNKQLQSYLISCQREREEAYRKYGIEALSRFSSCMESNGFYYTLAFGTMLGAIREHGFIKNDLDIDIFIWIDDYKSSLIDKLNEIGINLFCSYSVDNDKIGKEDTFIYNGCHIDIFYVYIDNNGSSYVCDFILEEGMDKKKRMPRKIKLPIKKERKLVNFENLQLYVPSNAIELCTLRYGDDFMIPKPNWTWKDENECIVNMREFISKTKYVKYD